MSEQVFVIGSSPLVDAKGNRQYGVEPPLFLANGQPHGRGLIRATALWNKGKVESVEPHWRNEAAKRRCKGDKALAEPKDLVQVPTYHGIAQSLVTHHRAGIRRSL